MSVNDTSPAEVPSGSTPRESSRPVHILVMLLALVVVLIAVITYGYSTRSSTPSVRSVVAAWAPNHKDFCAGATVLTQSSDKVTTKSESRLLHALEALSIHAPTRLTHQQLATLTVAFDNVVNDPAAVKALDDDNTASNIPAVKAYLKAAKPIEVSAGAANVAISSCSGSNRFAANETTAVAAAEEAYYNVVAGDSTGAVTPVTIAEYASAFATESSGTVTADGPDARFGFPTGPPVCVTMPNSSQSAPAAVACPAAN
jgi:hypothetical protein